MTRWILLPLLPPPPATFEATLPGGSRVTLHHRELIGLATLLDGSFESAEVMLARTLAGPGSTVIDVGANIGLFTLPLAEAVGVDGRVVALEPEPQNADRLRRHLQINSITNVDVLELAAGRSASAQSLYLARDPALHSTAAPPTRHACGRSVDVEGTTLDHVWRVQGRPTVSVVKIDVEGAELDVLQGSLELLRTERPVLFVESNTAGEAAAVSGFLGELGYRRLPAFGLQPWNHVYESSGADAAASLAAT